MFGRDSTTTEARAIPFDPRSDRLDAPGDNPVDVPILCVLTRFRLRSVRHLLASYLDYRRVMRQAKSSPGLLRSEFLIGGLKTFYTLSIWSEYDAISYFASPYHVTAGNKVMSRLLWFGNRPELWSTKWQLVSVSNNLRWEDFDLRKIILTMKD